MVIVSDKILKAAKAKLVGITKNWDKGVCNGAVCYIDDDLTEITLAHTACHAWLSMAYGRACFGIERGYSLGDWTQKYTEKSKNFLALSCHRKGSVTQEESDFLIKWMARESPFSEFILNRDDDESLTKGGVIMLCGPDGLGVSQAMWVAKVLRFTTEGGLAARTFKELVEGGVDAMLAVYVASFVRGEKAGKYVFTGVEGHSTVIGTPNYAHRMQTDLLGMIERNFKPRAPDTMSLFVRSQNVKAPRNRAPDSGAAEKISGFCKPFVRDDGWGGKITGNGASGPDLVRQVKEWEHELKACLPCNDVEEQVPPPMPDSNTVYLELDL